MLAGIIAINKTLFSVYYIKGQYYVDIEEVNVYSKRSEISNLPQLKRPHVTFVEWNAFAEFLFSIKSPSFLEQETIDAIKEQWVFDLEVEEEAREEVREEEKEEVKNNQPQKDDYFIKY